MQNSAHSATPGGAPGTGAQPPTRGARPGRLDDPDDGSPMGLRERKKQATARALHETAVWMVASEGLDGVTVDQICSHVGVSPRTFFNYYPSKEDALTASMPVPPDDDLLAAFEEGGPTGDLVPDLGTMVATHMASHVTSVDNLAAHHRLMQREPQLTARWRSALHAIEQRFAAAIAIREGCRVDDTGVVVLAAMTSAGIRTAMRRWVASGGDPDIDVHVDEVFALLADSLAVDTLLHGPTSSGPAPPPAASEPRRGTPADPAGPDTAPRDTSPRDTAPSHPPIDAST